HVRRGRAVPQGAPGGPGGGDRAAGGRPAAPPRGARRPLRPHRRGVGGAGQRPAGRPPRRARGPGGAGPRPAADLTPPPKARRGTHGIMLRAFVYLVVGWVLIAVVGGMADVLSLTIMLPATSAVILTHAAFSVGTSVPLGLFVAIALGYLE